MDIVSDGGLFCQSGWITKQGDVMHIKGPPVIRISACADIWTLETGAPKHCEQRQQGRWHMDLGAIA